MSELYPYTKTLREHRSTLSNPDGDQGVQARHVRAIAMMAEERMDRLGIAERERSGACFVYHVPWVHIETSGQKPLTTEVTLRRLDDRWALERLELVTCLRRYVHRGQLSLTAAQNCELLSRMDQFGRLVSSRLVLLSKTTRLTEDQLLSA